MLFLFAHPVSNVYSVFPGAPRADRVRALRRRRVPGAAQAVGGDAGGAEQDGPAGGGGQRCWEVRCVWPTATHTLDGDDH